MTSPTAIAQATELPDAHAGGSPISRQRRNLIFVALVLAMLLAALGATIVATALPAIVDDLGDAEHQSWMVTSFLLGATSVVALAGKLGDLFGRKRLFLAAVVLFAIASALCGLSQYMTMLVIFRALQGMGAGVISVTASTLVGDVVPLRHRGVYQGILGGVFGIGTVAGPLVGGYLSERLSWQWAFWIDMPVALVVLVLAATAIPALPQRPRPVIDYLGILLVVLGATGFILATSWGGTNYAWDSPVIIGLFAGSAAALGFFVWVESRASAPILPPRLFRSSIFAVCCALAFAVGFAMLGALIFQPLFLRYVNGASATTSGLRTLPMVIGILIGSISSGALVSRTGYKLFPVAGNALIAVGFLLLSQMHTSTPAVVQSLYLVVLGAGIGLSMQLLVLIVQNTSCFEDLGVATSGVTFSRAVGCSFGAAIFGTLFANFLNRRMAPALSGSDVSGTAVSSPTALHRLPADVAAPFVRAYAESLTQVFFWAAVVALVGFIVALFLRDAPIGQIHNSAGHLGDGFGMPCGGSRDAVLEAAIWRMLHNTPDERLRSIAAQSGCVLDAAELWGVLRINQYEQLFGTARLSDIAKHLHVPIEVLKPTFDRLADNGYVLVDGDTLSLSQSGLQQVDVLTTLILEWTVDNLVGSPGSEDRPDKREVEAALGRIAHHVLAEGDWYQDLTQPGSLALTK
ncbi:MDR family MFS transporter [Mycobacterium lacus]|uniref:Putative MFS-type transporter n=1 Tax=Mycobacterium lacus TaxID=169765 RepID=A0A1X1YXL5_9MYCO|nr:MDR family MFS transporter [Mycobacterium lacus]MCV7123816.1 MFS transporter [Mycobacterium lacus]ORW15816.1 MFS transporter [Mycobacterium lacus]BBX96536.1 putative MFS-type transporter [Mycobacterium lacus]